MNIRLWHVWIHPSREDMVLTAPIGSPEPVTSVYVETFIKQSAGRGGARIIIDQYHNKKG